LAEPITTGLAATHHLARNKTLVLREKYHKNSFQKKSIFAYLEL
jgi:hypothetical protein